MNNSIFTSLISLILCFNQINFFYCIGSSKILNAKENEVNLLEYAEDIPENSFYIIGPGDSFLTRSNEVVEEITSPFKGLLSTYFFFKLLDF